MSSDGDANLRVVLACDFLLRYSAMLAGGIARAGARVVLLSRDHDLEFGGSPGAARDFVRGSVGSDVEHETLPGRVRSPRGWAQALGSRRNLRRFAPHVVHVQASIVNDVRLPLVTALRPGRFAVTFHDPSSHPGDPVSRRDRVLDRLLARTAGLIFVHAEALRLELAERFQPRAPIVVVPHGIDPGTVTPLPARPAVLFFGRISRYKGLDVLLDAMAEVWRASPAATLTIAGAGEVGDHPALADSRVILRLGHLPDADVPKLIEAASCVVLPYRQASQSGVGSLAKPYARPLVVTAVGGLPELVADGSGLVVAPEDPQDLAAGIVSVLSDPERAQRLGAAGARTAAGAASWDAVAKQTLAAYREHLGVWA